jgi:hypothetical protein
VHSDDALKLTAALSLTSLCSLRKQLLCDFEIIRGSMANSKDDVSSKEWPMFLPVPEALMRKVFSIYAVEERQALPHKERGNELYRARRFEEALEEYAKALHCFSIPLDWQTDFYLEPFRPVVAPTLVCKSWAALLRLLLGELSPFL